MHAEERRRILREALEGGGWCSGVSLAERLGVSRSTIHRDVEALRREGLAVEARPGRGYRLTGSPPSRRGVEGWRTALVRRWRELGGHVLRGMRLGFGAQSLALILMLTVVVSLGWARNLVPSPFHGGREVKVEDRTRVPQAGEPAPQDGTKEAARLEEALRERISAARRLLAEMRRTAARLEELSKRMGEREPSLRASLESLKELRERTARLEGRLAPLQEKVGGLEKGLGRLRRRVAALRRTEGARKARKGRWPPRYTDIQVLSIVKVGDGRWRVRLRLRDREGRERERVVRVGDLVGGLNVHDINAAGVILAGDSGRRLALYLE